MTNIKCECKNCKCFNKKVAAIILAVGLLIGGGIVFLINNRNIEDVVLEQAISIEEAKEKTLNVINQHMLPPEITASLIGAITERGLHKITVDIQGQEVNIYLTKDGALLFPEAIDLEEFIANMEAQKEIEKEGRKCEEFQAGLTPERKEKIAKCLTERGYRVYIADWCPFCRDQKELFGEAAKYLTSIDCYDPEGRQNNIDKCPDLQGVPAWRDKDGNKLEYNDQIIDGLIQIRRLVEVSGCEF